MQQLTTALGFEVRTETGASGAGSGAGVAAGSGTGADGSGSAPDAVVLVRRFAGRCVATLTERICQVYALAVLADGRLASGSYDNTIKLWQ